MLFPEKKQQQAGQRIAEVLAKADNDPEKRRSISDLLHKHFGGFHDPNLKDLMPNAPANEKGQILRILRKEIMTQGQGGRGSFKELQDFKNGASIKGKWDRSISSAQQELYRNISRKYGDVLKEALPELKKPYEDYAKASQALKEHGGGISGALHTAMYGGGLTGWAIRNATIYPAIRGIMHLLRGGITNGPNPNVGSSIGFKGSVS